MDDPTLPVEDHRRALRALSRLNTLSRSHVRRWHVIAKLAKEIGQPIRVLDLATGDGTFPISIAKWAKREGLNITAAGCDVSDTALSVAREAAAKANVRVEFHSHDVLNDPLPGGFDVITMSLFLHHLDENDVVRVLKNAGEAAWRLVLVSDLARSRMNYLLVWLGCHLLTRSHVVRFDGPISVRAAFTAKELIAFAERAGLVGATTNKSFPCEFLLQWKAT